VPGTTEVGVSRNKKPRRKKSSGLLVKMRQAPSRRPKHKPPLYKRVVQWTFGLAFTVVILGAVVLLGIRFLAPNLGAEVREATVQIDELVSPTNSPDGRLLPIVTLDEKPTWLRDPPTSDAGEIVEGAWVHVDYEWIPATESCRVLAWEVVDPPS
jgi:hypothetical protein